MNHPKTPWSIGIVSNKHDSPEKSGFFARIGSRVSSVIRVPVDHQIDCSVAEGAVRAPAPSQLARPN